MWGHPSGPAGGGRRWLAQPFSRALTLAVVLLGWILFRTQTFDAAREFIGRIASWNTTGDRVMSPYILAALAALTLAHLACGKDRDWAGEMPRRHLLTRIAVYSVIVILIAGLGATDAAPFIYFQF